MKFVKIDMTSQGITTGDVPTEYEGLGGRGLTSIMINKEVPATCDPLGPENKLIIAPGYLSGTMLVNTSRLSIGAKSPLTGGIKESNVGGTAAADLAHLGITAIIVEGQPADREALYLIKIDAEGQVELVDAGAYRGLRTYELVRRLKEAYGEKNSITCIGPAGESLLTAASIQTTDADGRPCRAAGRGGLGAVMASKGLKAVVVDRGGKATDPLADADLFKACAKKYAQAVRDDDFTSVLAQLGSAVLVGSINAVGAFPTRNAREGQFDGVEKITGETMAEVIKERGGACTHMGCAQCIIRCSNEYVDKEGAYVTSSLEYETIWSMGGMLGNDDLDAIAKLDFLCDDIGLDTISTGVAVAVAMDAGYKPFGDAQAAIEMVEAVAEGTEMGKLIGNGPAAVGEHFNHDRVPVMKRQSMAAYDPRAIQGMAVTYATTPMGGDHTAGWVVADNLEDFGGKLDRFSAEGQVENSRNSQLHMAAVDTVGICDFAQSGFAAGLDTVCKMVSAKLGKPFGEDDWAALGIRILKAEREFNRKAGFTKEDDRLPKMFYEEPLPPHNKVVVVTEEDLDGTWEF
ncbi:MAG: aldehyde ferredoxin oxidoreductase [Deltaproteobacteria bacterium]|nr:aldehyde ferredoxin oxidoreductase [Deltaproteobacteria bacterium]